MHELCLEHGESLRPLVELAKGCPSVDTFERLLQRIEPQSLSACLQVYGKELIPDLEGKHIAIDCKRLKGSKMHLFSTFADASVPKRLTKDDLLWKKKSPYKGLIMALYS